MIADSEETGDWQDPACTRVEGDGVVGGGEDHAPDARLARRLEEIVAADDY